MTVTTPQAQRPRTTSDDDRAGIEEVFDTARRRQAAMLAEVRRRLAALAVDGRRIEAATRHTEHEAGSLLVHAAMPENAGPEAAAATARRDDLLAGLGAVADTQESWHEREQRLLALERELTDRIRLLDTLTAVLSAASHETDVRVLVDWALAGSDGSPDEDDECEAEF